MGILDWVFGRSRGKTPLKGSSRAVQALRNSGLEPPPTHTPPARSSNHLPLGRFGQHRHKPSGEWVQTTTVESVVGIPHRKDSVEKFCAAVAKAERSGRRYGVRLVQERANKFDPLAIAVEGYAANQSWHIGYLDKDLSRDLYRDLLNSGIPIEGELYSVWIADNGFIDVKILVLAPPGHGMKARLKRNT